LAGRRIRLLVGRGVQGNLVSSVSRRDTRCILGWESPWELSCGLDPEDNAFVSLVRLTGWSRTSTIMSSHRVSKQRVRAVKDAESGCRSSESSRAQIMVNVDVTTSDVYDCGR
jgi:hypothetical protein